MLVQLAFSNRPLRLVGLSMHAYEHGVNKKPHGLSVEFEFTEKGKKKLRVNNFILCHI